MTSKQQLTTFQHKPSAQFFAVTYDTVPHVVCNGKFLGHTFRNGPFFVEYD
ncbi:hypothetical protein HMPREF1207_04336 [Paenibacillus sp. HGH0039]|nr:hypothetical protein HMPREF1207_04336 [Paenibacillus sp. HGH0039]